MSPLEWILLAVVALLGVAIVALVIIVAAGRRGGGGAEEAAAMQSALAEELRQGRGELADSLTRLREELNDRLEQSSRTTGERLDGSHKLVDERLGTVVKRISDIGKELAAMGEAHNQIRDLAKDIAGLQRILQPPKARGSLGELLLENALREVLPESSFEMEYMFADSKRVDAAIKLSDKLVPVDSKFPLDSFKRLTEAESDEARKAAKRDFKKDVMVRIDETASYIRPGENTFDFALMYIPAENVYYETILKDDGAKVSIAEHARSKKVIPVSPNSLYAYLQAIALGLQGMKIEERAGNIMKELGRLGREFNVFAEEFRLVGKHLGNASGKFDESERRLAKFADRLEAIESLSGDGPSPDEK